MKTDVRARRRENERLSLFHIHLESGDENEFIQKDVISEVRAAECTSHKESFWENLMGEEGVAVLPNNERIRRKLISTLRVNCFLGSAVFLISAATLGYCFWNYRRMTANGLRSVLLVLLIQGTSLFSTSMLGLEIYKEKFSPWRVQIFYNMLLLFDMVAFLTINSNFPNAEAMIQSAYYKLDNYMKKIGDSPKVRMLDNSWCCSMNGFRKNCYDFKENSLDIRDINHESFFQLINSECSKFMGWALAETLIKSCSCFLVPALLLIILINSLIHLGSTSQSGFVRVCETEPGLGKEIILRSA